jgi:hypothetical protein
MWNSKGGAKAVSSHSLSEIGNQNIKIRSNVAIYIQF